MQLMEDGGDAGELALRTALRAEPGTADATRLEAWLRGMDPEGWRALLGELESIAREVAPRYRDVVDADDALGELVVLTCDRWLPRYLEELQRGEAPASLWAYLKVRLAGHLAELRRKRLRREALLDAYVGPRPATLEADEVPMAEALIVGTGSDPHAEAFAEELMRKAGKDPGLRAILALRYAGFTQEEIAKLLQVSRPTVSRRLAVLASAVGALLVAVLLAAAVLFGWTRGDGAEPEIRQDRSVAPPPVPAGGAAPPMSLSAAQIAEVTRANRALVTRCSERLGPDRDSAMVTAAVTVTPDGRVASVSAAGDGDAALHRCVTAAVEAWVFPPAPELTRTVIPFVFTRRGEVVPVEPREETEPVAIEAPSIDDQARQCSMTGDNACVIRLLEGRADTATRLAQLIEAYRARGEVSQAVEHMRTYVERFSGTPRARNYQQILERL